MKLSISAQSCVADHSIVVSIFVNRHAIQVDALRAWRHLSMIWYVPVVPQLSRLQSCAAQPYRNAKHRVRERLNADTLQYRILVILSQLVVHDVRIWSRRLVAAERWKWRINLVGKLPYLVADGAIRSLIVANITVILHVMTKAIAKNLVVKFVANHCRSVDMPVRLSVTKVYVCKTRYMSVNSRSL